MKLTGQAAGDPQGFQKAAGDYVDQRRTNNPGVMGEAIFQDGNRNMLLGFPAAPVLLISGSKVRVLVRPPKIPNK
ncbi:MAG: hypothetical protein ACHQAY_12820, partial [Hyphomicrobiales bacterium]